MNMMDFDTMDAREAYWTLKRETQNSVDEIKQLRKDVTAKSREIASLRRQLDNFRTRRHEFPGKYLPAIKPILEQHPTLTMDDILRGGGRVGNREPHSLAAIRRKCWVAVYDEFPEESFSDIGRAFNRSHCAIWRAVNQREDRSE